MRWLKSATEKQWTVGAKGQQIIIPAADKKWLCIEEDVYNEIVAQPVIKSLIKVKGIIVENKKPVEAEDSIPELQDKNLELKNEVEDLKAQLTEAQGKLKELEEQVANAEADKAAALAELDAKASKLIEERDTTIQKLEKKLKKLGGSSEEEGE